MTVCVAMICPISEARGRKDYNQGNNTPTEQRHQSNNRNNNSGNNKRPLQPQNHNRPQQQQWHQHNDRYHGSHGNYARPTRPGHRHHHFTPTPPPPRPMMPSHRPWRRPTPPPAFRPVAGWRPFKSILGVAFGSAIGFSVNALINAGYNVSGYGNDAVYVTNAPMLNMIWPDATLFYTNGGLYASEFVYSTSYHDMNRYYSTYNALLRNYGNPIDVTNANGIISSTWWGTGNQFISLTFQSAMARNGMTRFFTTLSFGN